MTVPLLFVSILIAVMFARYALLCDEERGKKKAAFEDSEQGLSGKE
jgi:hypothetical protein